MWPDSGRPIISSPLTTHLRKPQQIFRNLLKPRRDQPIYNAVEGKELMHKHPHRRFLIFVVLFTFAALPVFASHSWSGYHWPTANAKGAGLKLGDNVDSRWDAYLVEAEKDWEASVLTLSVIAGSTSPRRCNPDTGEIEVCNASYGNTGWLGVAGIWASGSHITKGYTKLNDTYFDTAKYNTPAWRRLVTCQEIGHDFGLGHQDENFNNVNLGTCMDYTNAPAGGTVNGFNYGASNEHPNTHDYNQLASDYSHTDATFVFNESLRAISRPVTVDLMGMADQWGVPIGYDRDGRPNRFERYLGNDSLTGDREVVITHVFWAPDAQRNDSPGHDDF